MCSERGAYVCLLPLLLFLLLGVERCEVDMGLKSMRANNEKENKGREISTERAARGGGGRWGVGRGGLEGGEAEEESTLIILVIYILLPQRLLHVIIIFQRGELGRLHSLGGSYRGVSVGGRDCNYGHIVKWLTRVLKYLRV
jgi:hypothetical protein